MNQKSNESRTYFKPIYLIYVLLIVLGIYLVLYHGPHLWTLLPLLLFLACPLMHLLMHHKHHEKQEKSESEHKNMKH